MRILLFLFWGIFFNEGIYAQSFDWDNPLCIASDTGIGGPRYIETNLPLNELAPPQTIEFKLRCKGDVPIYVQPGSSIVSEMHFANRLIREYAPTRTHFTISSTVKYLRTNQQQYRVRNIFDLGGSGSVQGQPLEVPALGAGQYHEFSVKIDISERLFFSNTLPETPKPIEPFYSQTLSVTQKKDANSTQNYAPYPIWIVSTFDTFPDPCVTPGPMVIVPPQIDFGTLNREDLEESVKKRFFFRVARLSEDTCNYNLYPIITFKATDPVINDEIYLNNGTILSLEEVHSGFGKIKLNTPMRFGELKPKEFLNLLIEATLRKNPDKPLRGGAFSTVLIYHIEYR
ncbi:hypothetical protein DC081_09255 [Ignatzschineria cameli]|uniref:Fimbrial-type adhesion domain-containing protein n=1 Tax=Ignatzschineria cameli TaxID=2182793 RepID=A0ABX5L2H4_9GAMM|nr:hypothetical protein DC080_04380 [Ignatzschineria cameli]PWD89252.1 hypothetical protein DC081_09255 [Ignatzschineria cameli]PWD90315.1 hypothetical protein DC079_04015 [Ignatzschineria cameli]PWD92992.1 hypothetical protein DC078_04015 [Ignatzschineria cameli]